MISPRHFTLCSSPSRFRSSNDPKSSQNLDPTYMDSVDHHQQEDDLIMEVPEINGDLLVELLDASLAAEEAAGGLQLGFTAGVDVGDVGWDSQELDYSVHTHHGCEDCGLDGVLSDLEACGRSRSPAPYLVFDDDDTMEWWTETADEAALEPFAGERMGEWYMDGMAMEWEDDGGSGCSLYPYYGGETGTDNVYGSPLWE